MIGEVSTATKLEDFSREGESGWIPGNRPRHPAVIRRSDFSELSGVRRRARSSFLPDIPGLPTWRGRVADGVFVLLLLAARYSLVLGAVVGGLQLGLPGAFIGLAGGWVIGVWMRWSLGLRRRGLTHGFVVRLLERGNNDRPKLLESLVETLRGHRLTARQCRMVAAAYAEATRRLQTCESLPERVAILQERDHRIREAAYGRGHAMQSS